MFNKMVDAFARVRPGFIVAAAVTVLGVPLAFARLVGTRIADVPSVIDFTDVSADLGALLIGVLLVMLIVWGVSVGTHSSKHLAH